MNLLPFFLVGLGAACGGIFGLTACLIGTTVALAFVIVATYFDL